MNAAPLHRAGPKAPSPLRDLFASVVPLLVTLTLWEACAFFSSNRFVPHLYTLAQVIAGSFWNDPIITAQGGVSGYAAHVLATLVTFLTCIGAGSGAGFVVSVTCFPWIAARGLLSAALRPWHVIPPLIVIPLAYALLGPYPFTSWLGGAFYAFVSTGILVVAALSQVPVNLINLARLAGAGPLWIAWRITAMSVLPMLVGPVKIVGSFTLGVVVILEYLAVPVGIGRVMKFAIAYNSVGLILAGVFWATLIGYAFGVGIDLVSRSFLQWAPKAPDAKALFSLLDTQRLAGR